MERILWINKVHFAVKLENTFVDIYLKTLPQIEILLSVYFSEFKILSIIEENRKKTKLLTTQQVKKLRKYSQQELLNGR